MGSVLRTAAAVGASGAPAASLGTRLVREFESAAKDRGCLTFYLETFNFQAPGLYAALGYEVAYEHAVYPHGIVRYCMVRKDDPRRL